MCEFCGDGPDCSVCGRGRSINPTCWEVFHQKNTWVAFRTRYKWLCILFCSVFRQYDYTPDVWSNR